MIRHSSSVISLLFLFAAISAGSLWWIEVWFNQPGPLSKPRIVIIEKGVGALDIAEILAANNVVGSAHLFTASVALRKIQGSMKAGEYTFSENVSPRRVVEKLTLGQTIVHKLTIPEGTNRFDIIQIIKNTDELDGPITDVPEEGWLLPETYHFPLGELRSTLINRMHQTMQNTLSDLWENRTPMLPFNDRDEALIMASIIEKETAKDEERSRVAGVFINRLRLGMPLQSDPTVVYSLTNGEKRLERSLTRADLRNRSKYNTYQFSGLPPGPITNPGKASLFAALNPAATDDLYFVADGQGGHRFAQSLTEHNKNVALFRLQRKKMKDCGAC